MDKKKIIIDCDPGYDDAVALLLAAGSPSVEVLAITTVAGNQTLEKVTRNALRIATLAGLDVPVAAGAARPLLRDEVVVAANIHGQSGLDGTTLPQATLNPDPRHAAQLIVDTVMNEPPQSVTLVPIGPLTNIALAARLEPRIVERVKELVLMGGGYHIGNVKPMAEFNIENDPEAAHIVFEEKWPIVMVGLDLTYQALATQTVKDKIAAIHTPASYFVTQVLTRFSENYKKSKGFDEPPVHDACAVAYVIDPGVIETRKAPVHVEYRGEYTSGMTVTDLRRKAPQDCHTAVAMKLDRERFWNLVIEAVGNL
jgi:purine nucleosidase